MKALVYRIFQAKPFGHGGERRSAQIDELYHQWNIQPIYWFWDNPFGRGFFPRIKAFNAIWRTGYRPTWYTMGAFRSQLRVWYYQLNHLRIFLHQEADLFCMEVTSQTYYIILEEALRSGKKVIAIMHNLESLVRQQSQAEELSVLLSRLHRETSLLRRCHSVYTISKEENWLLRLLGVNSYYLPYYPAKECQEWLLRIRHQREKQFSRMEGKSNPTFLMVGSALNPPTAIGMQQIIDTFAENSTNNLRVAGYGTTQHLRIPENAPQITLLGEISNDELAQEMASCTALLINQPPTTGALTRIVEALIAGVPVLANTDSMRDYFGTPGTYEFRSPTDLSHLLTQPLPIPPLPAPPIAEFQ